MYRSSPFVDRVRDIILSAFPLSAEHVYDLGTPALEHCISGHDLLPLVMCLDGDQ